jgi:autotransporter passenger strand-loop-strand repeat protein
MASSSTPPSYVSGAAEDTGGYTYTSGQSVYVISGGGVYNMTIDANAYEDIGPGGHATGTVVNKNGTVSVEPGGVTTGSIINGGGYEDAFIGTAISTIVNKGGEQDVDGGGTAIGTILNLGIQSVTSGSAVNTIVHSGGVEAVTSSGTDTGSTLSKGGGESVNSGGIAYDTKILAGGTEFVTEGGTASGSTVASGGRIILAGEVLYTDSFKASSGSEKVTGIYKDGVETITFKGAPKFLPYDKIVASSGGDDRDFYSGSKLVASYQRIGDEVYTTSYSTSGNVTYSSTSPIPSTGSANDITVDKGGSAVLDGGSVTGLTVASGGTEIVGEDFSILSAGGKFKFKISGVVVSGGSIGDGGREIVNAKDATVGALVASGGTETIEKQGIASNTVISGGTLDVVNAGAEAGAVYFEGTGGAFIIGASTMPTTVISGFAVGDQIELAGVTYSAGAKAQVKTAGVVTITDGGATYSLNIAGAAVGEKFSFASGSILTETASAGLAPAQMRFLTPPASAGDDRLTAAVQIVPAVTAPAAGWLSKTVTPGPLHAALTSAPHSALVAALSNRGGTESF